MIGGSVLALALALGGQDPAQPGDLERQVLGGQVIVVARVASVRNVDQVGKHVPKRSWAAAWIPVAELEVERVLLGAPDIERLFALGASSRTDGVTALLGKGDRALLFLGNRSGIEASASPGTRARLQGVLAGEPLYRLEAPGVWKLGDEGFQAPDGCAGPAGVATSEELVAWVDARVEATTPSLTAGWSSTGPSPWRSSLDADGAWRAAGWRPGDSGGGPLESGDGSGVLAPADLDALWRAIAAAGMDRATRDVGRSHGPCSSCRFFEVRTRAGVYRTRVWPELEDDTAATRALRAQALEAWSRLPDPNRSR